MEIDKDELYIYFYSLILSVCVLFITILWAFTCDFYLVGDTWAKGSKRRQNRTKWAENGECWWACLGMVLACRGMTLHHTKNPRATCRDMILLCRGMLGQSNCWFLIHAVAWQNHAAAWRPWLENFIFEN